MSRIEEVEQELSRVSLELECIKSNPIYKLSRKQREVLHKTVVKTVKVLINAEMNKYKDEFIKTIVDIRMERKRNEQN